MSNWKVIAASVQGAAHVQRNLPCQDAHAWRALPGGGVLLAAADGAGSAPRSAQGANLAVECALDGLQLALQDGVALDAQACQVLLRSAFTQARQALLELAEQEGVPARQFAATLTLILCAPPWLAAGQVGDGVAIAETDEDVFLTLTQPQHGEYANETYFLTQEQALDVLQTLALQADARSLAVMTDGLVRLAMDVAANQPYRPFFAPLMQTARQISDPARGSDQLAQFLASERVCNRTEDDKTLALAVRLDEE